MERPPRIDAVAYVDETNQNSGRYAALCAVTVLEHDDTKIAENITTALDGLREFKFSELSDGRQKRIGLEMAAIACEFATQGSLRVDLVSWDKTDSRHAIRGRDDFANMERMLHHLFVNAIPKWSLPRLWELRHDRQDQVGWKKVIRSTNAGIRKRSNTTDPPEFVYVESVDSHRSPIIQFADMFAGMAAFLRGLTPADLERPTRSTTARIELLQPLVRWMQVRCQPYFVNGQGLITPRNAPFNFWPYRSAGPYDRAPTKASRHEPRLASCVEPDCDAIVVDSYGLKYPRCHEHYMEHVSEKDESERADAIAAQRAQGTHYCGQCATVVHVQPKDTSLDNRTFEYVYRCKRCGTELTALESEHVSPMWGEEDARPKGGRVFRPDVRLPRQNYGEDD